MRLDRFQVLAVSALVALLLLIAAGAVVRVTGSGMGCPDWPTCWGRLVPPTAVGQVDFERLPVERFRRKAERMGRDPSLVTRESLRAEFNARHVWTEFINRLLSLPVGFLTLFCAGMSFGQVRQRPLVTVVAVLSLFVVLFNAWMGARVVYSGLKPGVLTAHMALAMSLTGMLVYCAWRGCEEPWRIRVSGAALGKMRLAVVLLLVAVVAEGITGTQVREMTDVLAKFHDNAPRETWIGELEGSGLYLFHRSFSWAVAGLAVWAWWLSRRHREPGGGMVERGVLWIVVSQMLLGILMARIHIYSWAQVLHVWLAAVLLSLVWLWLFGLLPRRWGLRSQSPEACAGGR